MRYLPILFTYPKVPKTFFNLYLLNRYFFFRFLASSRLFYLFVRYRYLLNIFLTVKYLHQVLGYLHLPIIIIIVWMMMMICCSNLRDRGSSLCDIAILGTYLGYYFNVLFLFLFFELFLFKIPTTDLLLIFSDLYGR